MPEARLVLLFPINVTHSRAELSQKLMLTSKTAAAASVRLQNAYKSFAILKKVWELISQSIYGSELSIFASPALLNQD